MIAYNVNLGNILVTINSVIGLYSLFRGINLVHSYAHSFYHSGFVIPNFFNILPESAERYDEKFRNWRSKFSPFFLDVCYNVFNLMNLYFHRANPNRRI